MAALAVCSHAATAAAVAATTSALGSVSLSSSSSSHYSGCATASFAPLRAFSVPGAVTLRHLLWVGQKSKRKTKAGSSLCAVSVAAATVVEEVAAPAVSTEVLPVPKKIGKGIVRLRLTRLGRKKRPFYRIVATHHSWRRDGKYIELLGHYNPLHAKDDLGIVVKADRIKYWLGVGAQPSDTVTGILHKVGIFKKAEVEQ